MCFSGTCFFFFFCFCVCVGVCGRVYAGWEMDAEHAAPAANVGKGGRIGSRTQRRVFLSGRMRGQKGFRFFFVVVVFCTHVSKHACPDEGKKGDDGCSVPDRGRERVFIHFLCNPTTTHYLSRPVPFRPPWLVLVFVCDMLCEMRSWGGLLSNTVV